MRTGPALACACLLLAAACGREESGVTPAPAMAPTADTVSAAPAGASHDGATIFSAWCEPCHGEGAGHPGTFRLGERLGPEQAVLLERSGLDAGYVKTVVRNGFQMMPPFRETEISDADLDVLAAWLASGPGRATDTGAGGP